MEKLLERGIVVENEEGLRGVVIEDSFNNCNINEAPVVFEGNLTFTKTTIQSLKKLGHENAIPNPEKCGAGRGTDCCIFLSRNGCERFGPLRYTLISKKDTMRAQREPTEMYPDCQIF